MKQISLAFGLILAGFQTGNATSWAPILDTDLVHRADWIVVGKFTKQEANSWTLSVDRVVHGDVVKELEIVPISPFKFYALDDPKRVRIYAVTEREGRKMVFHPACIREVGDEPNIRQAMAMFEKPGDFLGEPKPEMAYVISKLLGSPDSTEANGLNRKAAIAYLKTCLKPDDPALLYQALRSLGEMEDWTAVHTICEMIGGMTGDRDVGRGINSAITYLMRSKSPEAVERLEQLLAETAPDYPASHWLADPAAQALGKIRTESSRPVLEEAAKHGVQRAEEALVHLGTLESFDILTKAYLADKQPGEQHNTMMWLVRRSNRPEEDWMYLSGYSYKTLLELKPKWEVWLEKHREGMKIVRTAEEAIAKFRPQ